MKIIEINGSQAKCEANGIVRLINIFLIQDQIINIGDYVMVHVGYAIQKVEPLFAESVYDTIAVMRE